MTSTAKIEANRENARHSTGPKTDAGRARAAMNAFKHGLTSLTVALKGEDLKEFQRLKLENRLDLAPMRTTQQNLCDQISYAEWKLLRIAKWETQIIDAALVGQTADCQQLFGETPADALERLHRYEAQVRRGMHQDLRALGRLQKNDFENTPLNARRLDILNYFCGIDELQANEQNDKTNPTGVPPPSGAPANSENPPFGA
jgi:hypothetical protein